MPSSRHRMAAPLIAPSKAATVAVAAALALAGGLYAGATARVGAALGVPRRGDRCGGGACRPGDRRPSLRRFPEAVPRLGVRPARHVPLLAAVRRSRRRGRSRLGLMPEGLVVEPDEDDSSEHEPVCSRPQAGGTGRIAGVVPDAILGYPSCRTGWSDDVRDAPDGQHRPHADVQVQAHGGATSAPAVVADQPGVAGGSKPGSESSSRTSVTVTSGDPTSGVLCLSITPKIASASSRPGRRHWNPTGSSGLMEHSGEPARSTCCEFRTPTGRGCRVRPSVMRDRAAPGVARLMGERRRWPQRSRGRARTVTR